MNIFKRLLKLGQSEIHALVEKMEDPISLTEQGIEDMKSQLAETQEQYLAARAIVIRMENNIQDKKHQAQIFEEKARLLLLKAQNQELPIQKADGLAMEALRLKKDLLEEANQLASEVELHQVVVKEINNKVEVLKFNIVNWEKELTSLKAKRRISSAAEYANRQMATMDANSTIDMLKKMKERLGEEQAFSEALGEIAKEKSNRDIDLALRDEHAAKNDLEDLKKQMGLDT